EPSGVIRAYDVHTGHLVWNWDSGNPHDTTLTAEGKTYTRTSPHLWPMFSVDAKPSIPYLPTANLTPDQLGACPTPPSEKYPARLTALDIATGKRRWHFQFTQHAPRVPDVAGHPPLMILPTAGVV
ncbi:hypothetical protein B1218_35355, partial [Pseudomonas ogarae]